MKHTAKPEEKVYIRSMGKSFRITAIFTTDDEANEWMARHPDDAVIACFGPFVLCASKYDRGLPGDPRNSAQIGRE